MPPFPKGKRGDNGASATNIAVFREYTVRSKDICTERNVQRTVSVRKRERHRRGEACLARVVPQLSPRPPPNPVFLRGIPIRTIFVAARTEVRHKRKDDCGETEGEASLAPTGPAGSPIRSISTLNFALRKDLYMNRPGKTKKTLSPRMINILRLIIAAASCLIIFLMLALTVTPSQYDIKVGDPAPSIIKATKEVVDEITTKENQDREVAKVQRVKKNVDTPEAMQQKAIGDADAAVKKLKDIVSMLHSGESGTPNAAALESVNSELTPFGITLTLSQLRALYELDSEELTRLGNVTVTAVGEMMGMEIFADEVENTAELLIQEIAGETDDAEIVSVFSQVVENNLTFTVYYDDEATEKLRQEARANATVVKYVTGQVIVEDGKPITEKQYAMLKTLGLVDDSAIDLWLYVGIAILVIIMISALSLYLYLFEKNIYQSPKQLLIIALSCFITLLLCVLTRQLTFSVGETQVYIMPVMLGILLIALLIRNRVALFVNVPLSIIASMLSGSSGSFFNISTYTMVISSFVSGCVALRIIKRRQTRLSILLAGVGGGLAGIVSSFSLAMISSSSLRDSLIFSLFSGVGGPISAIICIALMPAFEVIFNVITTNRLIEMSNPNHPLLRRLLLEAPGTYHHSIIVANLAEAAAADIGANSLLARVGAYYHDIGKLVRPSYYTENQVGDNPHDRTEPRVSTAIITAHPRDGAQMLREHHMPEEIVNITLRHHGDTPVVFFYNKALNENSEVDVDDFRYPGPRPHTKEEAIIMMADTVEAATRAIQNPDRERVREVVEKLINQKISDGQLDDCELSLKDISRIENAFVTVLSGSFHERIEYPDVEIPKKHSQEQENKNDAGHH